MKTERQKIGARGEDAAARFLQSRRFKILDRNWRSGSLELDLVCEDGEEIVFVEVKTRTGASMTTPAEGISPGKKRNIVRAARAWLGAHRAWERICRFDVVCVMYNGEEPSLEHCPDAFSLSDLVDSRHADRQFR
jgi:putative endonuclease